MRRVFYLHGFASSARSTKAAFFSGRLAPYGIELETPDFNEPDFSSLTVSRMVQQVAARIDAAPDDKVALVGSSLGGFVAVLAALQRPARVDRLVLLAPALDFGADRESPPGDRSLAEWRKTDRLEVFHYGYGRVMPIHYELYLDARRYDVLAAQLDAPVQVFQGRRDTVVDPEAVRRWAAARPERVELQLLDDDHQLQNSLEEIWRGMARFLGLPPAPPAR